MGGAENPRRGFAGGGGEESAPTWEDGQVRRLEASRLSGVGLVWLPCGKGEETGCPSARAPWLSKSQVPTRQHKRLGSQKKVVVKKI